MAIDFGTTIILPNDAGWFFPRSESLFIQAFAVSGPDSFVLSAAFDGEINVLSGPYSRFYRYDKGRWLCVEVEAAIADLLILGDLGPKEEDLVVLGTEGEVWFVGSQTRTEHIPNVKDGEFLGSLTRLRRSGGILFALGFGGYSYRRHGNAWVNDDQGLAGFEPPFSRKRKVDAGEYMDGNDIVTLANGDQYLCGAVATARPALFWRPAGTRRWQWLGYAIDDPSYDYMVPITLLVEEPDTVWVAVNEGAMFKGNAATGFRIVSEFAQRPAWAGDRVWFDNAVFYRGEIYAGSNFGAFRLRSDGSWDYVGPNIPPKEGEFPYGGGSLGVSGDILWTFGPRDVARFDGREWQRVPMPSIYRDNPP